MEKQELGNGIYLPKIIELSDYPTAMIFKSEEKYEDTDRIVYALLLINRSIFGADKMPQADNPSVMRENFLFFYADSTVKAKIFFAIPEDEKWHEGVISWEGDQATYITSKNNFQWTNSDISEVVNGVITQEYFQRAQQINIIYDAADAPQYKIPQLYYKYEIFDYTDPIDLQANPLDNGELTYEWYEKGKGLISTDKNFIPTSYIIKDAEAITGQRQIYCLIINSKNNTSTLIKTLPFVIQIVPPTPHIDNNAELFLGHVIGKHFLRQSTPKLDSPLIDLYFKEYLSNTPIIPNIGTLNEKGRASVNLNSGRAYYDGGLVLTKNANFSVPVEIVCDQSTIKLGNNFSWILKIDDYVIGQSEYQCITSSKEGLFTVFYNNSIKKFQVISSFLPNKDLEDFYYNSSIIDYDSVYGYTFNLQPGDTIAFTGDTKRINFYINGKIAMRMGVIHILHACQEQTSKSIVEVGCGDIKQENNNFDLIKISRFLFYNQTLNGEQIKRVCS